MAAAERLHAGSGPAVVSDHQVGEAARQGDVAAVSHHFGTKEDLVGAIVRRHSDGTEQVRDRMLEGIGDSRELRDWGACLVRPATEQVRSPAVPSWYARFTAQVMTGPVLRTIVADEALVRAPVCRTMAGMAGCLLALLAETRVTRGVMALHLLTHTWAEPERALAQDARVRQPAWQELETDLTDAVTGLLSAPVTPGPWSRRCT